MARIVGVMAVIGLLATACGSDTVTTASPSDAPIVVPERDETAVDAPDAASVSVTGDASVLGLLAFAASQAQSESYTFTQGMTTTTSLGGETMMRIAPEGPIAFGEVSGESAHITVRQGAMMESMFVALPDDEQVPSFLFPEGLFDSVIEVWTEGDTAVLDMSDFATAITDIDPDSVAELGVLAEGPVKIDVASLDDTTGMNIVNQFARGVEVVDPAQILQSLLDAEVAVVTGTGTVGERTVDVYTASISMADYAAAVGTDFGTVTDEALSDEDALIMDSLADVAVDMQIMIDAEQLVRRLEMTMDLSPIVDDVGVDYSADVADLGGLEIVVEMWQEFDDYGSVSEIELPDAPDLTAEFAELADTMS